jgi:predicted CxxxxCH...CXXCH cytochrome family protein
MRIDRIASLAVVLAAALTGCNSTRPLADGAEGNCTGCHGGLENQSGAPPYAVGGAPNSPAIGAHTTHLARGVLCESCHVVPANVNSPGHIDGEARAEVLFHGLANTPSAAATYDATAYTCSTYCHGGLDRAHGGNLSDGALTIPSWTADLGHVNCTSCHGFPPVSVPPHNAQTVNCFACHPDTVDATQTPKPGGKHVNGVVDTNFLSGNPCTRCHGDPTRTPVASPVNVVAPPVGSGGETATTTRAVGAHQRHLEGGTLAKPIACGECHVLPSLSGHPNGVVEMTWGPTASAHGATPTWTPGTGTAGTCANYCHGQTLAANGTKTTPVWTLGASETACGSCHALPPPAPHPQVDRASPPAPITAPTQCVQCHPGTVTAAGTIDVAKGLHVNGVTDVSFHPQGWATPVNGLTPHGTAANYHDRPAYPNGLDDCAVCHSSSGRALDGGVANVSCDRCHTSGTAAWRTSCTFCHGSTSRGTNQAAPPADTQGRLAPTDRGVGAHQTHLSGRSTASVSDGVACVDCHTVPANLDHVNGSAQVATKQPRAGTVTGTFDAGTGTCASTYCHGGFQNGKAASNTPSWTATEGQNACGTCHRSQRAGDQSWGHVIPAHDLGCQLCHAAGYGTKANPALVNLSTHVDGALDVGAAVTNFGYSTTGRNCTAACHGPEKVWSNAGTP